MGSWVTRTAILWLFLVASMVGCATIQPAPAVPADESPSAECLPPGISAEFLQWPVARVEPASYEGDPVYIVWFVRAEQATVVVYDREGEALIVDPHPELDTPAWFRLEGQCRWQYGQGEQA